jgi:hypothetical protein
MTYVFNSLYYKELMIFMSLTEDIALKFVMILPSIKIN